MRYGYYVLIGILFSGCGTTTTVKLTTPLPEATSFTFRDERPPEQRLSRTDGGSFGANVFFGDDSLTPPVPELLKASLENRLHVELAGRTVSLTDFVVNVFDPAVSVDIDRVHSAAGSVPGGYAAAPLAGLFILGIEKVKSEKIVHIEIKGKMDLTEFSTTVSDRYRGRVTEDNIRTSLTKSLEQVVSEVKHIAAAK